MSVDEARRVLRLGDSYEAADVKAAFRSRAFDTHPDRGGSAAEFLRVQAAYERLRGTRCNGSGERPQRTRARGSSNSGPAPHDDEDLQALLERLHDIDRAFRMLDRQVENHVRVQFRELPGELLSALEALQGHSQLRDKAQEVVGSIWLGAMGQLVHFLEEKIGAIADDHDGWLRAYLRPLVDHARYRTPPRWHQRRAVGWVLGTGTILAAVLGCLAGTPLVVLPAVIAVVLLSRAPDRYKAQFELGRLIERIQLGDVLDRCQLGSVVAPLPSFDSAQGAVGGSLAGAGVGFFLGGPLGALVGAVAGGLLGHDAGISVEEHRHRILNASMAAIDSELPRLLGELRGRVLSARDGMKDVVRSNFKKNFRVVVKLLTA